MALPAAQARAFLTAQWRALLMLSWEIDPALLKSRVPAGTELDEWNGRCLVSMVGLRFRDTRVLGRALPFHRNFEEVNLRFYVRRKGPDGWRRGVVFVSEMVPRRAIAWVARALYGERYRRRSMRSEVALPAVGGRGFLQYEWKQGGGWDRLHAGVEGAPRLMPADSEETFITEHYWGYATRRGATLEYRVEHPRWKLWPAVDPRLECAAEALYGSEFAEALGGAPSSALVAEGSPVVVRRGVKL